MIRKLILKSTKFLLFGANLTQFEVKSAIPVPASPRGHKYAQRGLSLSAGCQHMAGVQTTGLLVRILHDPGGQCFQT